MGLLSGRGLAKAFGGAARGASVALDEERKARILAARDDMLRKYQVEDREDQQDFQREILDTKVSQGLAGSENDRRFARNERILIEEGALSESGQLKPEAELTARAKMAAADSGLIGRAVSSADITIAGDPDLTTSVAESKEEIERGKATGKQIGGDIEKTRTDRINVGFDAAKGIPTVVRGLELLERVETGGPESIALSIKQKLGVESADEGELSNKLGKAVLTQLRATFGAAFTEREGERLERIEASFSKNPETNKRLLNELYQVATMEANQAIRDAEDRGDYDTASSIREAMNYRFDEKKDIFSDPEILNPSPVNRAPPSIARTPEAPATLSIPRDASGAPRPETQAQYDAMPSGTVYIDPDDGKQYRKP